MLNHEGLAKDASAQYYRMGQEYKTKIKQNASSI